MSGWDWIHAGLEIATFTQAQKAQRNLTEMKTAAEMEAARRYLLEAMKSFVFDISRDIQLAEEQLAVLPQQVYIVAKSLEWRFANSGLSADVFPDFQDKEYVFKTQKKITEVVGKSKENLAQHQIQQSDIAVQYITEMPMLQQAINAKAALESINSTNKQWQSLSSRNANKNLFLGLGIVGILSSMCVGGPIALSGLGILFSGDLSGFIIGLLMIGFSGAMFVGSILLLMRGGKSNQEFAPLKAKREAWQKQLMPHNDWLKVVATIGDLTSEQFRKSYEDRLAYLTPLLGGDFNKYLTSGE